jgi:hypothetical protein
VVPVGLNNDNDIFIWQLKKNGMFSTQSLYREILSRDKTEGKHLFWRAKLPLKIKNLPMVFEKGGG